MTIDKLPPRARRPHNDDRAELEVRASALRSSPMPLKRPENVDATLQSIRKEELADLVERIRSGCGPTRLVSLLRGYEVYDYPILERALEEAESASPARAIASFAARIEEVANDIQESAGRSREQPSLWLGGLVGAVTIVFEELAAVVLLMTLVEDREQSRTLMASGAVRESA